MVTSCSGLSKQTAAFILKCVVFLLGHVILRVDEVDLKLQSVSCWVEAAALGGQFHFQDREPERQTDTKQSGCYCVCPQMFSSAWRWTVPPEMIHL